MRHLTWHDEKQIRDDVANGRPVTLYKMYRDMEDAKKAARRAEDLYGEALKFYVLHLDGEASAEFNADRDAWLASPDGQCRCTGFDHRYYCPANPHREETF